MNEPSAEDLQQIADASDRFEEAWRRGESPAIDEHLDGAADPFRDHLFRQLLGVEIELRRELGQAPIASEYEARWPSRVDSVREVFLKEARPDATRTYRPIPASHGKRTVPEAPLPRLPGYEILGEIGRGGMGIVYKAYQPRLDRFVAIKTISPGASTDRFGREARLIAQIRSPYVVALHDMHVHDDGEHILLMEYVEGVDLAHVLKERGGPIAEDDVLPWMRHVAMGMLAAAECKIIHRDLKPSNILIDSKGRARLVDFGLGRGPANLAGDLTRSDDMLGTPYYMALEQAEDPQGVDTRADIYSFGALFYHVLTGVPPFGGRTAFAILFQCKTEPLISPRARNPSISPRTSELLERCLAKAPADRFPSFAELLAQLDSRSTAPSPWEMADDSSWAGYLATYKERRDSYLHGPPREGECDVYEFPRGRILRILRGDLIEQNVEALVSSQSWWLPMDYGVSQAIRQAAGSDFARETSRFAPVRPGRVAVTTAGRLPSRFVFHGVTMGRLGDEWVLPSRDLIAEIVTNCFHHADTLNVKTIAFPLLGTGAAGFSPDICLDTLFRTLGRTFLHGLTCVQEARIVIYPLG